MTEVKMENPLAPGLGSIANKGTTTSNYFININGKSTGTLTGKTVDAKLDKADRLLDFSYGMRREVNSAAENTLFSAGEIDASWVYVEVLRTQAAIYVQNSFIKADNLPSIKVFRADDINGKLTVTEEIDFSNCIITQLNTSVVALEGQKIDNLKFWFRYLSWKDTLFSFNQEGQPVGQNVFSGDLSKGTLGPQGS